MKKKYLEFIATFMIMLVFSIPFYVSSVNADVIGVHAQGEDEIEGFVRESDRATFVATVEASDPTKFDSSKVILGGGLGEFDSCDPLTLNGFSCEKTVDESDFGSGNIPFTVNLDEDSNGVNEDSLTGTFTVDREPPQATLSVTKNKFSSADQIRVQYTGKDIACKESTSACRKCVGIREVQFRSADGEFEQTIENTRRTCEITLQTDEIDPALFEDGEVTILARSIDNFDQESETSVTFEIDNSAPSVDESTFSITVNNVGVSTFSKNAVPATVQVNVSADDFRSARADLSSLDGSATNKGGNCVTADDIAMCSWQISYRPTEGQKTITITTEDVLGNTKDTELTKTLTLDDKGPEVKELRANSNNLVNPVNNTIVATFDEVTGIQQVFLHTQNGRLPGNCKKQTDWICTWEKVSFSSDSTISIRSDSIDVLGNPSAEKSVQVTLDNSDPVLVDNFIDIYSVSGTIAFSGVHKIGDSIVIEALIEEENSLEFYGDFSQFIEDAHQVPGTCEEQESGLYTCSLTTDRVNLQAEGSFTLTFRDAAGNSAEFDFDLETYGLEEAPTPNFWESQVSCSPRVLDRQLGPLLEQRAYCTVRLTSNENVETVFVGNEQCAGDLEALRDIEIFNDEPGSTSPILKFTLKKDDFRVDNVSLRCSLDIFSKKAKVVTKNPEIENFEIKLEFANMPLGELGEGVQQQINDAKKNALENWKIIGQLNKLFEVARRICQTMQTMYTLIATLYFVSTIFKVTEKSCTATILGNLGICQFIYTLGASTCGTEQATTDTTHKFIQKMNKFCDFVTCRETLWGDSVREFIDDTESFVSPGKYLGAIGEQTGFNYINNQEIGTRPVSSYMNPRENLLVASMFGCIPGIVTGLNKYRQIQCLYADCLENAVGQDGLPVKACQDQKNYATCKYVTGELFALYPWTAAFDYFTGIIKSALSDPFTAIGVAVSAVCRPTCVIPADGGKAYMACKGGGLRRMVQFLTIMNVAGETARNFVDIKDNGFSINQDYCDRLELDDEVDVGSLDEDRSLITPEAAKADPIRFNQ